MRQEPTWRIPVGIFGLLTALVGFCLAVAHYVPALIGGWHVLAQAPVYLALGVIWLLPLRRFLIWMETGRWSPPEA